MYETSKAITLPPGTVFSTIDPAGRDPRFMTWFVRADPTAPGLKITRAPQNSIARILKPHARSEVQAIGIWVSPGLLFQSDDLVYIIPREEAVAALDEWQRKFLDTPGELGIQQ